MSVKTQALANMANKGGLIGNRHIMGIIMTSCVIINLDFTIATTSPHADIFSNVAISMTTVVCLQLEKKWHEDTLNRREAAFCSPSGRVPVSPRTHG